MSGRWCSGLLITLVLQFFGARAGLTQTALNTKLEAFVSQFHRNGMFDGTVLVTRGNQVLLHKGYGLANRDTRLANTPDTRFRIGSITKAFTAVLVLQLVDSGRIVLDAPVSRYLPDFERSNFSRITVRQLLTHTSGLPDYNDDPEHFDAVQRGTLTNQQRLAYISSRPLRFEPGTQRGYSNDGYHVLGAVLERVTGVPYAQLLAERILKPLRMANTGYMSETAVIPKLATGYRRADGTLEQARYYRESPASGMYATTSDLHRFYRAITKPGLLSQKSLGLLFDAKRADNAYGLHKRWGFDGLVPDSALIVEGDGAVFGYFARTIWIPRDQVFIAAFTNVRSPRNRLPDIVKGLVELLYKRTPTRPQ